MSSSEYIDSLERKYALEQELLKVIPASEEVRDLKKDLAIRFLQGARYVFGNYAQYYTDDSINASIKHFATLFALRLTREKNYTDVSVGVKVGQVDRGYVKRTAIETADRGGLYHADYWSDHYAYDDDEVERIYVEDIQGKKKDVVLNGQEIPETFQPVVRVKREYCQNSKREPKLDQVFARIYYEGFREWVYAHAGSILIEFAMGIKKSTSE